MKTRLRPGEQTADIPFAADAALQFIGIIRTPWTRREDCPRQGQPDGPICRVELATPWTPALKGIERHTWLEILYWLDQARRDLLVQNPRGDAETFLGTFALRSPQRPNPIGTSLVRLEGVEGATLKVRGLDCLDGTPLLDIKPDRCGHGGPGRAAPGASD